MNNEKCNNSSNFNNSKKIIQKLIDYKDQKIVEKRDKIKELEICIQNTNLDKYKKNICMIEKNFYNYPNSKPYSKPKVLNKNYPIETISDRKENINNNYNEENKNLYVNFYKIYYNEYGQKVKILRDNYNINISKENLISRKKRNIPNKYIYNNKNISAYKNNLILSSNDIHCSDNLNRKIIRNKILLKNDFQKNLKSIEKYGNNNEISNNNDKTNFDLSYILKEKIEKLINKKKILSRENNNLSKKENNDENQKEDLSKKDNKTQKINYFHNNISNLTLNMTIEPNILPIQKRQIKPTRKGEIKNLSKEFTKRKHHKNISVEIKKQYQENHLSTNNYSLHDSDMISKTKKILNKEKKMTKNKKSSDNFIIDKMKKTLKRDDERKSLNIFI